MPDLDQLLDTLAADVAAGTRAPGAPRAIKRAQRRRTTVAVAAAVAVAVVVVGGGLAAGTLGGSDRPSPSDQITSPAPTVTESADAVPGSRAELHAILTQAPGWAINTASPFAGGYDYAFNGRCAGDWEADSRGGHDGGLDAGPFDELNYFGDGAHRYGSRAQASEAVATFVHNLSTCTRSAWRVEPIAQTGALLASSPTGVAWILQDGREVRVFQAPTVDGPPPASVQVAVARWFLAYVRAH